MTDVFSDAVGHRVPWRGELEGIGWVGIYIWDTGSLSWVKSTTSGGGGSNVNVLN